MDRSDIILQIYKQVDLTYEEISYVMYRMFDIIEDEIKAGKKVELRNFGIFNSKIYKGFFGRNPKKPEGTTVVIPPRRRVTFRPCKQWRDALRQLKGTMLPRYHHNPLLKFRNTLTNEVYNLPLSEWVKQYGVDFDKIVDVRKNKRHALKDNLRMIWVSEMTSDRTNLKKYEKIRPKNENLKTMLNCFKPPLKFQNTQTNEIREMVHKDWKELLGVDGAQLSRARYNRQNFIFDKDRVKWIVIKE